MQCLLKGRILDYGCGRGYDAKHFCMDSYDPYWYPIGPFGLYDTITCLYVLNVLPEEEAHHVIMKAHALLKENGSVYFSVRRDIPKGETHGKRYGYQRYVTLPLPEVFRDPSLCIYKMDAHNTL
jgi:hypothetical protein